MVKIIKNEPKLVVFQKTEVSEQWFKDCSNKNLLKESKREGETVDHVKWEDGDYTASLLNVYLK